MTGAGCLPLGQSSCVSCGTCVAGCPSGAIRALHFSDEQVYAEIEGILV
jgi:heterodisulfide reductase subunit A